MKPLTPEEVIAGLKSCPNDISKRSYVENNKARISALLIDQTPSATTPEAIALVFKEQKCTLTATVAKMISDNLAKYKQTQQQKAPR